MTDPFRQRVPMPARHAAELAAREAYSRLLAFVAARARDVASAEDALADAFAAALEAWPRAGVPDHPEAWLMTAARRRLLDEARRVRVRDRAHSRLLAAARQASRAAEAGPIPDERLTMLFLCAHPAIDPAARTPLMLQAVLGLAAEQIASAFLVSPAALSQRLVRAKAKIRDAGISFSVPPEEDLPERLPPVLDAVYAAFGLGWDGVAGAEADRPALSDEAIGLGRLLADRFPSEPEVCGLLALMLHCRAREPARRDAQGRYVPLSEQDTRLWDRGLIDQAESLLWRSSRLGRPGRFQLEAAIQSAHAARAVTGRTDWEAVLLLYEGLASLAPSIGALVARAAAIGECLGPSAGLEALEAVPEARARQYQPWWALRARLLGGCGRAAEAREAAERAAGLSQDPAVRAFLLGGGPPAPRPADP